MDKIVFNQLIVEVTRRCNMHCAHCLRGDAENVDLLNVDIDSVLDQTEAIGRLIITGGEPTLNLSAVQHIANGIVQRGIPVMRVQIITNGKEYNQAFVILMKRFSEITNLTQLHGYGREEREPWRVQIGVSLDHYHEAKDVCRKNYIRYKNMLKGYAEVLRVSHGNAPQNEGRAATLENTIDCTLILETYMLQQIEVLSIDHRPMCKFYDSYRLERPDQKVVCCGIYLNAYGDLLPGVACDMDFEHRGIVLCGSWEPIWEKILEYNKLYGRKHCTFCEDIRTKINLLRPKEQADRESRLTMSEEAKDETSREPIYIGDIKKYQKLAMESNAPDQYQKIEQKAKWKEYLVIGKNAENDGDVKK